MLKSEKEYSDEQTYFFFPMIETGVRLVSDGGGERTKRPMPERIDKAANWDRVYSHML